METMWTAISGGPDRRRKTAGLARVFLLGCLLGLVAACQGETPTSNGKAAFFKRTATERIEQVGRLVAPKLAEDPPGSVTEDLIGYFRTSAAAGRPVDCAVAVLDKNGMLLAGRYPVKNDPTGATQGNTGQNYGQYKTMEPAFKNGSVVQTVLYYGSDSLYAVCGPIRLEGKQVGVVCVAYDQKTLENDYGLDPKEFAALDFKS